MRKVNLVVDGSTTARIDKYLSDDQGLATRAQVQRLIKGWLTARPSSRATGCGEESR
jgi:hypothetical protein